MPQPQSNRNFDFSVALGVIIVLLVIGVRVTSSGVIDDTPVIEEEPAGSPGPTAFASHLTGAGVVPATPSKGTGAARFTLDEETLEVQFEVSFENLIGHVEGMRIGRAPARLIGPAVYDLVASGAGVGGMASPLRGSLTLDADHLSDLQDGNLYLVIDTYTFSGPELRGQIVPSEDTASPIEVIPSGDNASPIEGTEQ